MTDPFSKETLLTPASDSPQEVRKDLAPISTGFEFLTLNDWSSEHQPVEWLCEGLHLARGTLAMIAGDSYSGKSVLAQDLAISIAGGDSETRVLRQHRATFGRVVYLDYEQGKRVTMERFRRLARAKELDIHHVIESGALDVAVQPELYLNAPNGLQAIRQLIESDGQPSLIVIDTLRAAAPGEDENSSDIRRHIDPLSRLAHESGTSILLVHHAGKSDKDDRSKIRGSSAIFDAFDSIWLAQKTKDEPGAASTLRHLKCRPTGETLPTFTFNVRSVPLENDANAGLETYVEESSTSGVPNNRRSREEPKTVELGRYAGGH